MCSKGQFFKRRMPIKNIGHTRGSFLRLRLALSVSQTGNGGKCGGKTFEHTKLRLAATVASGRCAIDQCGGSNMGHRWRCAQLAELEN